MNKFSFSFAFIFILACQLIGQEALPKDPKKGMCYIRCVEEDTWREKEVQVLKRPGFTKLEVVPAEFKTVTEQVLIKEASKKLEIIPAVFKKAYDTLIVEDGVDKLTLQPIKFSNSIEEVVVQPAFARFETKSSIEKCNKKDPRDCEVLCFVEYPEHRTPVSVQKIETAESYISKKIAPKTLIVTKDVIASPATVREIEVPAVYKTITKKVLVKTETVREIQVAPQYENQLTRVLEKQGGMSHWVEIDCKLTDFNVLPIYYALNSAVLNAAAKEIINTKIYDLMVEKPRIRIEINSHTDSRNSDAYNIDLSQRRAQSVVDYLISKGIKSNRLVAKGYGESRLKEPCPDDVNCSEDKHAKNRRTEFRVLTN